MNNINKFFINGKWVEPNSNETLSVINPATEEVICDKKYYKADEDHFRSSNILGIIHCFNNKFK